MKIIIIYKEDTINLGNGYLSIYLKRHGHQVGLLIMPSFSDDKIPVTSFMHKLFYKENIIEKDLDMKPDLTGFSVVTANYQWALEMARQIKEKSKVPIIFGAHHSSTVNNKSVPFILQDKRTIC